MKKLMFVMPYLFGGGAERVVAALAGEISRMDDCEVHLAVYYRDGEKEYPVDENVRWHSMEEPGTGVSVLWRKISFLHSKIKELRPDCVISLGGAGVNALLMLAIRGLKTPLILSERNDPARDPQSKLLRLLRWWTYSRCDGIVFQTSEAMRYFPENIARKGRVISNPLTGALPERYTGEREKRIVTSCRLNVQKNLDLMIDAFADIAQRFQDYSLHIYGEGEERQRLEEKIRTMKMENRIFLCGYSNHIYEDIYKAAMYVSSSDYEGISNSMLEAIALGIPTVCTDCPAGGARETIRHGVNGLLVPVRNREKLAQAMAIILENEDLAQKLSREGENLRTTINREAVARQWLSFVEQVEEKYGH